MSAGSRAVKVTAKTTLKGKELSSVIAGLAVILSAFVVYLTASLLSIAVGEIAATVIYAVACVLLIMPLVLGVVRFFWRMLFSAEDSPVTVFYYLSEKALYFKSMRLVLSVLVKLLAYGAIVFAPVFLLWFFSQGFLYEALGMAIPMWSENLNAIFVFLRSFATVVLIAIMLRYYLAPVLFIADENMDVSEALHMSTVISRKTYLDFVFLGFSFIGWIAISVLIIPLAFTLPYMLTAYVIHVRFAIAEYNMYIEKKHFGDFEDEV